MHNPFLQELKETHNTLFWFENGAPSSKKVPSGSLGQVDFPTGLASPVGKVPSSAPSSHFVHVRVK